MPKLYLNEHGNFVFNTPKGVITFRVIHGWSGRFVEYYFYDGSSDFKFFDAIQYPDNSNCYWSELDLIRLTLKTIFHKPERVFVRRERFRKNINGNPCWVLNHQTNKYEPPIIMRDRR